MRKFLIMTLFMLLGMSLNAKNVSIKDIIGNWIFVPNEGTVMAGDIIMKISIRTRSLQRILWIMIPTIILRRLQFTIKGH